MSNMADEEVMSLSKAIQSDLALAKKQQGLSLEAIAEQLKISPARLKIFEQEDFDFAQLSAFERGYLKNYAHLLKVDLTKYDAQLQACSKSAVDLMMHQPENQDYQKSKRRIKLAFGGVFILVVSIVLIALA